MTLNDWISSAYLKRFTYKFEDLRFTELFSKLHSTWVHSSLLFFSVIFSPTRTTLIVTGRVTISLLFGRVDAFRPKGHGFDSRSSRLVAQATVSEGLAQSPYATARAGVDPMTLRTKCVDSTNFSPTPKHAYCISVARYCHLSNEQWNPFLVSTLWCVRFVWIRHCLGILYSLRHHRSTIWSYRRRAKFLVVTLRDSFLVLDGRPIGNSCKFWANSHWQRVERLFCEKTSICVVSEESKIQERQWVWEIINIEYKHLAICRVIYPSTNRPIHLSFHLLIYLSIYPSIHPSIHPSINRPIHLYVHPFIHSSIH